LTHQRGANGVDCVKGWTHRNLWNKLASMLVAATAHINVVQMVLTA
jgi:hypothetical protein